MCQLLWVVMGTELQQPHHLRGRCQINLPPVAGVILAAGSAEAATNYAPAATATAICLFSDDVNTKLEHGGQRIVTVLMYLSTPEEGGETVFPDAERKVSGSGWSECALKGLANKPVKGDALMFYR